LVILFQYFFGGLQNQNGFVDAVAYISDYEALSSARGCLDDKRVLFILQALYSCVERQFGSL
jgi:hypothetical protein